MSIRARVGRHTREGGRQCQNWADDQRTVTDLLNRIAVNNGGAAGGLTAPIRAGICGDALYAAITKFEDKYFPGQRGGYVDPGGPMLKRMETIAAAPITRLDRLRFLVLSMADAVSAFRPDARWTAGDRVQLDVLVQMAVMHIDVLKTMKDSAGKPLDTLPWWGEAFGRIYFHEGGTYVGDTPWVVHDPDSGDIFVLDRAGNKKKVDAIMQYGRGMAARHVTLITAATPALLLFSDGVCYPMPSLCTVRAMEAHEDALSYLVDYLA